CLPTANLKGEANQFEYYQNRLLLMMEGDCATRWGRFKEQYAPDKDDQCLDELAWYTFLNDKHTVYVPPDTGIEGKPYSDEWKRLSMAQQAASIQLSIVHDITLLIHAMRAEVTDCDVSIKNMVFTGGLAQSKLIERLFANEFGSHFHLYLSDRSGPLAYQTATFGALINAMVGDYENLGQAIESLCPLKPIKQ
ncbi:MAG: hypothetical protein HQ539_01300, partial [Parcubacteria group bacterium]|nr:hypothetical protein [Parcubacteria group bacterium]